MVKKYSHIIVGGTFDHFHLGHQEILKTAFTKGQKVTIGIVGNRMFQKKPLSATIETFSIRKKHVIGFLEKKGWLKRSRLIKIENIYGTSLTDKTIEAIVVSSQTKKNALIINKKRSKKGWPSLRIICVPYRLSDDKKPVSSYRIRSGEINEKGRLIKELYFHGNKLILPDNLREFLRIPLGTIFFPKKLLPSSKLIITVGDIITQKLWQQGVRPNIVIIDHKTKREKLTPMRPPSNYRQTRSINAPGTVDRRAVDRLDRTIKDFINGKGPTIMMIDGEEDLLVLPSIILSPAGSLVLYGHWQFGAVVVEVTEKMKAKVAAIISKFDRV